MELLVGVAQLGGVSGLDRAGDQRWRHVTVGKDPVVEAAQAKIIAETSLGRGA
jgi:hypothetical protein